MGSLARTFVVIAALATAVAGLSTASAVDATAHRVLFVSKAPFPRLVDQPLIERLAERGFDVDVVDQRAVPDATLATTYDLIWISASVAGSAVGSTYAELAVPLGTSEYEIYLDQGLATEAGQIDSQRTVDQGGSAVTVVTAKRRFHWGRPGPSATVLATVAGDPSRPVNFFYDEGDALVDGRTAPSCRAGFFAGYNTPLRLNGSGFELFDSTIDALLGCGTTPPDPDPGPDPDPDPGPDPDPDPGPVSGSIGFVGGKIRTDGLSVEVSDRVIIAHLEDRGFTVEFIDDDFIEQFDLESFEMLMLSSGVEVDKVGTKLAAVPRPLLSWEGFLHDDMGLASRSGETSLYNFVITPTGPTELSAGYSGGVNVHTEPQNLSWGQVGEQAVVGAWAPGRKNRAVIFGYRTGATLVDGSTAPAARVGFFFDWNASRWTTPAAWDLFDAATDFARNN